VKFLTTNIQTPKLSGISSASLRRVCLTCTSAMTGHLPSLLAMSQSLDQLHLSNPAANWFIEGLSVRLSVCLSVHSGIPTGDRAEKAIPPSHILMHNVLWFGRLSWAWKILCFQLIYPYNFHRTSEKYGCFLFAVQVLLKYNCSHLVCYTAVFLL